MDPIFPTLLVIIKAEQGSISNKSEIEEAMKATGNTVVFVKYAKNKPYQPELAVHQFYQKPQITIQEEV
jgi:hypothetical protein